MTTKEREAILASVNQAYTKAYAAATRALNDASKPSSFAAVITSAQLCVLAASTLEEGASIARGFAAAAAAHHAKVFDLSDSLAADAAAEDRKKNAEISTAMIEVKAYCLAISGHITR